MSHDSRPSLRNATKNATLASANAAQDAALIEGISLNTSIQKRDKRKGQGKNSNRTDTRIPHDQLAHEPTDIDPIP